MTFATSIQYYPGDAFLGSGGNQSVADWRRSRFFIVDGGSSKMFGYELDGTRYASTDFTQVAPPFCVDLQGFLYNQQSASNFNGQQKLNQALELVASWGFPTAFGDLPGVELPVNMAAVRAGNGTWLFGCSQTLDYRLWMVDGTAMGFGGLNFFVDENGVQCCAGASSTAPPHATVFAVGYPSFGGAVQLGVYKVTIDGEAATYEPTGWPAADNPGLAAVKLTTILPATIDATWTLVLKPGVFYDYTDDNLIIMAQTSESVAVKAYVMKINSNTGAIMWKTPFVTFASGNNQPGQSRIRYGKFCYIDTTGSGHVLHTFNTITGVDTQTSDGFAGLESGPQCFDDTTGIIYGNFNYVAGAGTPTQRGDTPTAFSNQWASLYASEPFIPAYISGGQQSWTKIWGRFI